MEEIWKDIYFEDKGKIYDYRGFYQVSNLGRVKSLSRERNNQYSNKEIILKQSQDDKGYCQIILNKDSKRKSYKVHKLVAEMFLDKNKFKSMPNEDRNKIDLNKLQINHINEFEKNNNCVENLEYCTRLYNCNYGTRKERISLNNKQQKKVMQYDLNGNFIKEWTNSHIAEKELKIRHINEVCLKKRKTAGGYVWKFKEE